MSLDPRILDFLVQGTKQYEICKLASEGMSNDELVTLTGNSPSYVRAAKTKGKMLAIKRGYAPEFDMTHPTADGFFVKGVSTLYGDDGQVKQQWVKTDIDRASFVEQTKELVQDLVQELPQFKPVPYEKTYASHDLMAVYPLGDPHIGMLALQDESGEDWDLKTSLKVFCGVFDRLVKSAPSCEQAVIVNLGDYFHYDNASKVTERHRHSLDTDGTYVQMADVGLKIMITMINSALEHHKSVKVITTIGNHDDTGAMFLQAALNHIYMNEDRVEIDMTGNVFQYVVFGKCMFGVHHGHTAKMDKLPLVMAADRPIDWGTTEHRYWFTGHIHTDSVKEFGGVRCESFRTLASRDSYAHSGGWRSGQDSKAIVLHKLHGEVERHTMNISQIMR